MIQRGQDLFRAVEPHRRAQAQTNVSKRHRMLLPVLKMAGVGFRWLDILEKEFDKAFVDLDITIGKNSEIVIVAYDCDSFSREFRVLSVME